jgi:hypothetical protein
MQKSWKKQILYSNLEGSGDEDPLYWGRILGRNSDKSLRVFFLAFHSRLCSFALRFIFLQTHATSYSFYSWVIVHCMQRRKEENMIENHTPLPYGLRKPYRNLKFWELSRLYSKPYRNLKFWELSRLYYRNLNEIVRSWIRLLYTQYSVKYLYREGGENKNRTVYATGRIGGRKLEILIELSIIYKERERAQRYSKRKHRELYS